MTPAEYAFILSQIFLARAMTPFTALLFAVFWFVVALARGW